MGRPAKAAEKTAEIMDRFANEVDLNMALCGALGGMAAYGGIVPPLTRILMVVSGAANGAEGINLMKTDWDKAALAVAALGPGGLIGGFGGTVIGLLVKNNLEQSGFSSDTATKKANEITSTATFAGGALEAMLMYRALGNPEVLKSIIAMPAEIAKGVGEIIPG